LGRKPKNAATVQAAAVLGAKERRALRDQLIATYRRQEEFQIRHDQLKAGVALSQPFDDDGICRRAAAAGGGAHQRGWTATATTSEVTWLL
jgi:hypothetical protein